MQDPIDPDRKEYEDWLIEDEWAAPDQVIAEAYSCPYCGAGVIRTSQDVIDNAPCPSCGR